MSNRTTHRHKYRFPWREGNRFELLVDGGRFFPAMLKAIDGARQSIYLEMYLFESGKTADKFIHALIGARHRQVEVYLLLDHYGAMGLRPTDRQRLLEHDIHLAFYNPFRYGRLRRNLFRDHRKLLLIDGRLAFTGGAGIIDAFDPDNRPRRFWHDAMVAIEGPCVEDWQQLFVDNWRLWSPHPLPDAQTIPALTNAAQTGRVVHNRQTAHAEVVRSFVTRIRQAERRVWLASAYFVPPWKLRRALRRAARKGADVRLLLPGPHSDHPAVRHMGRRYYESLLRNKIRIFEYQPRFLHSKILLCDHWVSIGSTNTDRWNYLWNLDANQEVDDSDFAQLIAEQFEQDFDHSKEILRQHWQRRAWYQRLAEWGVGRVVALLSWFSERQLRRKR